MAVDGEIVFVLYRYDPSIAAATVSMVLFRLTTSLHSFQLLKYKTWYFIPFVLGGLCQFIGYGGRVWSSAQTPDWTNEPFIIQSLLILIAPALYAASIYMVLGRIVLSQGAGHLAPIKPRYLTKLFVGYDVVSFCMQGAGGGMLAVAKDAAAFDRGEKVVIGGLFVQIVGFGLFVFTSAIFHFRLRRHPTPQSTEQARSGGFPWQRYMFVLYAVSLLIFWRSLFRAIEYLQGYDGALQGTEVWLYVFDAALMFLAMVILNVWHPSKIIAGKNADGKRPSRTSDGLLPLCGNGTVTDLDVNRGSDIEIGLRKNERDGFASSG